MTERPATSGGKTWPRTRCAAALVASSMNEADWRQILQTAKSKVYRAGQKVVRLDRPGAQHVSQLFLVLHLQSLPFRRPMDNILATMMNLSLVIFFLYARLWALEPPE